MPSTTKTYSGKTIQAFGFDRASWTAPQARAWLTKHAHQVLSLDESDPKLWIYNIMPKSAAKGRETKVEMVFGMPGLRMFVIQPKEAKPKAKKARKKAAKKATTKKATRKKATTKKATTKRTPRKGTFLHLRAGGLIGILDKPGGKVKEWGHFVSRSGDLVTYKIGSTPHQTHDSHVLIPSSR